MRLTVIVVALLLAFNSGAAVPVPSERERWTRLQAGNLTIFSNARDGVTRSVAENIEQMRSPSAT